MLLLDRLVETQWLFDISLWDSNRAKLFISSPDPGPIFLLMLAICLLAIVVLGFGFYIWFFISSSEHSHVRLLNILNLYLSVGCIGGGILAFSLMIISGLGYPDHTLEHIIVSFHMVAITLTFLLISFATFLNQFLPKVYLDLSVNWRHFVAVPSMLLFCIVMEAFIIHHCCISLDDECIKITIRRFVVIPATCISFVLQIVVIIDDGWGFKNMIKFVIPLNETPVNHFDNPLQGLNYHGVSKYFHWANYLIKIHNSGIHLHFNWVLNPLYL